MGEKVKIIREFSCKTMREKSEFYKNNVAKLREKNSYFMRIKL